MPKCNIPFKNISVERRRGMDFLQKGKNGFLHMNFEKRQKIEMKGSLTLPKVILQIMFKGKIPPQELIAEALESIENVVDQLG